MDATPIELVNNSTQIPSSEKEEEDLFCRVCHSEAETNRPLFHPCKCAGSIKYVHQDCLMTWLRVSGNPNRCELCGENFIFRHVYAPDTPALLPPSEFLALLIPRIGVFLEDHVEGALVFVAWFIVLPLISALWLQFCIFLCCDAFEFIKVASVTYWLGIVVTLFILLSSQAVFSIYTYILQELQAADILPRPQPIAVEELPVAAEQVVPIEVAAARLFYGASSLSKCCETILYNLIFISVAVLCPVLIGRYGMQVYSLVVTLPSFMNDMRPVETHPEASNGVHLLAQLMDIDENLLRRFSMVAREAAMGYIVIFTTTVCAATAVGAAHYNSAALNRVLALMWSGLNAAVQWNLRTAKHLAVIATIFCALPTIVGWLIDVSTLKVFDCSLTERLSLCRDRLVFCTGIHWLLGSLFVLYVAAAISEMRTLVRPGFLLKLLPDFSNDIADLGQFFDLEDNAAPAFHDDVRSLASLSPTQLLERILLYSAYCLLGVMLCVLIPVQFGHLLVPMSHPVRFQYENTIFDVNVSLEMLFHFILPFALERVRHRNVLRLILRSYLVPACRYFKLQEYFILADDMPGAQQHQARALIELQHAVDDHDAVDERAFQRDRDRLGELQMVRDKMTEFSELTLRYKEFFQTHERHPVISPLLAKSTASHWFHMTASLDALKLRRLNRLSASLSSIQERRDIFARLAALNTDPAMVQMLRRLLDDLAREYERLSERIQSLESLDVGIRGEAERTQDTRDAGSVDDMLYDGIEGGGEEAIEGDTWRVITGEDEVNLEDLENNFGAKLPGLTPTEISWLESMEADLITLKREIDAALVGLQEAIPGESPRAKQQFPSFPALTMTSPPTGLLVASRCAGLALTSMLSIGVFFSLLVHVPLATGHLLLRLLGVSQEFDMYNIALGALLLWAFLTTALHLRTAAHQATQNAQAASLYEYVSKYALIVGKVLLVGILWLTVIPFLVGLLVDLLFLVPILTEPNETPFYPLLQCWAVGLVFLKMWARGVLLGMNIGGVGWRERLERVLQMGFERLDVTFVIGQIISPILITLLDHLLVPFLFSRIALLFCADDYLTRTYISRWAYVVYMGADIGRHLLLWLVSGVIKAHNDIRDSIYLLGTELANR